jgi:FkbM family methyltransferase
MADSRRPGKARETRRQVSQGPGPWVSRALDSALARVIAALRGLAKVIRSSGSLPTAAVLSCVYLYSKLQGTRVHLSSERPDEASLTGEAQPRSFQRWVVSTELARRRMRFHMRDGSQVKCRIVDSGGLLSVHVDRDYDIPGLNWSKTRTIVDVGAHVGSFTIWAALRSPAAKVLAIEPNPETFQLLLRNLRDNELQNRATAVNFAVGGGSGVAALELIEHSLGTRLARSGKGRVTVMVQKLERLIADAGIHTVDLLKIDCEGMEYQVFETMSPDQLRRISSIACEYHPEPGHDISKLDTILSSAGFTLHRPDAPLGIIWATR